MEGEITSVCVHECILYYFSLCQFYQKANRTISDILGYPEPFAQAILMCSSNVSALAFHLGIS